MKKDVRLEALTSYITDCLKASDRFICSLVGITPASLCNQKKELFDEIKNNKVGRRLGQLYYVVHHFADQGISNEVILECLRNPSFQDLKGNSDSVSSAIIQDKYETEVLLEIGKLAYQSYQRRKVENDSLFPVVKEYLSEVM